MREEPSAPVQVRCRCLVIRAAADKEARRSITISHLHPSSSLHQRPKASVTSDAALITTCSCFDCLRVVLLPPTPPPNSASINSTISSVPPIASYSLHSSLGASVAALEFKVYPRSFCTRKAHKEDVTRHMRQGLAAPLYLHIAASLVVVVVMQVAFVWREPRREKCRINLVNPVVRGWRVKSLTAWICLTWIKLYFFRESDQATAVQGTMGSVVCAGVVSFSQWCNKALMMSCIHKGEPVPLISDEACRIDLFS